MYVRNVAGYNFAFKYRDAVIYVPADGKIYSIPDDSGVYRELRVIPAMHVRTQKVTYINKNGAIASEKISGHKRRGRPPKKVVDPNKPLKGVKAKRPPKKEEPITEEDNSVVDIDLDAIDVSIVKDASPVDEKVITVKKKVTVQKKRGRPAKKKTK